jgi:hypothetical protein
MRVVALLILAGCLHVTQGGKEKDAPKSSKIGPPPKSSPVLYDQGPPPVLLYDQGPPVDPPRSVPVSPGSSSTLATSDGPQDTGILRSFNPYEVIHGQQLSIKNYTPSNNSNGETRSGPGITRNSEGCTSPLGELLLQVEGIVTQNPSWCCDYYGSYAVYITHAQASTTAPYDTPSGFEPFWDQIYQTISDLNRLTGTCFVMTGVDVGSEEEQRPLAELLSETNVIASVVLEVQSMMSTDPTQGMDLANLFRLITDTEGTPSIGIFNAGFDNLNAESIVTGQERLPYIGYTDDWKFGTEAAAMTIVLLQGVPPRAVCFNARPDLDYIGLRCSQYYQTISPDPPKNEFGILCQDDSSVASIIAYLREEDINAVYTHGDCCRVVAEAVEAVRSLDPSRRIVAGCMDEDTSAGGINFVTTQPYELQAVQAHSWAVLPVVETEMGADGKAEEFFPSLLSLVETAIYSEVIYV